MRNGSRGKTVISDAAGEVQIDVPRDREGDVRAADREEKAAAVDRGRRDRLSLYAKGMTTGEISAHFAEIYGASVSKETISRITDKVVEECEGSLCWAPSLLCSFGDPTLAATSP
ncbi:hypothetical protein GCM10010172_72100 [Paractinoplanes ferrugineus]|uniref:Mutator family transposase n=1 Tax=Paractinoplanes ferrugineus TaxID=113564 RepID=A0A919IZD9_9ACTN|nr:hypothetical protein Afe05nite_34750 [Actinoplanes ferrugineus]